MCCTFKFKDTHKVVKGFRLANNSSKAVEISFKSELLQKIDKVIGEDLKVTLLSGILLVAVK
jgi:hypothetical protein